MFLSHTVLPASGRPSANPEKVRPETLREMLLPSFRCGKAGDYMAEVETKVMFLKCRLREQEELIRCNLLGLKNISWNKRVLQLSLWKIQSPLPHYTLLDHHTSHLRLFSCSLKQFNREKPSFSRSTWEIKIQSTKHELALLTLYFNNLPTFSPSLTVSLYPVLRHII